MFPRAIALSIALFALSPYASAQGDITSANNVTDLEGTWSSNAAVSTGGSFCVPAEMKFNYPDNTGISYSFTNDGYFEEAQYRYTSNASNPACIQATIFWQHGKYALNNDGSMTLTPFESDGRIQVQDPCAAVTNIITYYNQITQYSNWGIEIDQTTRNYVLKLNRFDGAKMPYMSLIARPPNMLPNQVLTGTNASGQQVTTRKRSTMDFNPFKRSAAPTRMTFGTESVVAGILGVALSGVAWVGISLL